MTDRVSILGSQISRLGFEDALNACDLKLAQNTGGYVCFANVHNVTEGLFNTEVQNAINQSFLSVADGVPLVWASLLKNRPVNSRVCGPDFMNSFVMRHVSVPQGFIGGVPGVAQALAKKYSLSDAICYSPPLRDYSEANVREDLENFIKLCPKGLPQIIWVGLGAPKQELWIHTASKIHPHILFFGVGAAFDFLTEKKRRAPLWMQKSGLEWLFRLSQEPGRLWKRYFVTNSLFILKLTLELMKEKITQK